MHGGRILLFFTVTVWCPVFLYLSWRLTRNDSNTDSIVTSLHIPSDDFNTYVNGYITDHGFSETELKREFPLNLTGSDIILYVRIQKTGSTQFVTRLTTDIDVSTWCPSNQDIDTCRKNLNYNLFVLKDSYGPLCGRHADFTRFQDCAEDAVNRRRGQVVAQRHFYITTIRDPVARYISEWENVKRGGSWPTSFLTCNKKKPTESEVPSCYNKPDDWVNFSLNTFMNCPSNLAINRQTRMLADLTLVNCYNTSGMSNEERQYKMLQSAKTNIKNMAFYGLTEHQELSQILFENTFHLKFTSVSKTAIESVAKKSAMKISPGDLGRITSMNRFDVMLYQYAEDLFAQRAIRQAAVTTDPQQRVRIVELARPLLMKYKS